jgi:hypothetical protein
VGVGNLPISFFMRWDNTLFVHNREGTRYCGWKIGVMGHVEKTMDGEDNSRGDREA